jgi:hypothetical protein
MINGKSVATGRRITDAEIRPRRSTRARHGRSRQAQRS